MNEHPESTENYITDIKFLNEYISDAASIINDLIEENKKLRTRLRRLKARHDMTDKDTSNTQRNVRREMMRRDEKIVKVLKPDGSYVITKVDLGVRRDGTVILVDKTEGDDD